MGGGRGSPGPSFPGECPPRRSARDHLQLLSFLLSISLEPVQDALDSHHRRSCGPRTHRIPVRFPSSPWTPPAPTRPRAAHTSSPRSALAWTNQDQCAPPPSTHSVTLSTRAEPLVATPRSEIFDIVSALESAEGKGTTFCAHTLRASLSSLQTRQLTTATRARLVPQRDKGRHPSGDQPCLPQALARAPVRLATSLCATPHADDHPHPARTRTRTTRRSLTASLASASLATSSAMTRGASSASCIIHCAVSDEPDVRTPSRHSYDFFHDNGVPKWRGALSSLFPLRSTLC